MIDENILVSGKNYVAENNSVQLHIKPGDQFKNAGNFSADHLKIIPINQNSTTKFFVVPKSLFDETPSNTEYPSEIHYGIYKMIVKRSRRIFVNQKDHQKWIQYFDVAGARPYYFEKSLDKTLWSLPGLSDEEARRLPNTALPPIVSSLPQRDSPEAPPPSHSLSREASLLVLLDAEPPDQTRPTNKSNKGEAASDWTTWKRKLDGRIVHENAHTREKFVEYESEDAKIFYYDEKRDISVWNYRDASEIERELEIQQRETEEEEAQRRHEQDMLADNFEDDEAVNEDDQPIYENLTDSTSALPPLRLLRANVNDASAYVAPQTPGKLTSSPKPPKTKQLLQRSRVADKISAQNPLKRISTLFSSSNNNVDESSGAASSPLAASGASAGASSSSTVAPPPSSSSAASASASASTSVSGQSSECTSIQSQPLTKLPFTLTKENISAPIFGKFAKTEKRGDMSMFVMKVKDGKYNMSGSKIVYIFLTGLDIFIYSDAKSQEPKPGFPNGKFKYHWKTANLHFNELPSEMEKQQTRMFLNQFTGRMINVTNRVEQDRTYWLIFDHADKYKQWLNAFEYSKKWAHENMYENNNDDENEGGGDDAQSYSDETGDEAVNSRSIDQNAAKQRLIYLLAHRPRREQLEKNGIMMDEMVFGSTISKICESEKTMLPTFVFRVIQAIESRGLTYEGLYRLSGTTSIIQKLRFAVNTYNYSLNQEQWEVHTLTGALKMFFKELKQSLLPNQLISECTILIEGDKAPKDLVSVIRKKIKKSLPKYHYNTAHVLFHHLYKVAQEPANLMNETNLATVFGPNLQDTSELPLTELATAVFVCNRLVDFIIKNAHQLFDANAALRIVEQDGVTAAASTASASSASSSFI